MDSPIEEIAPSTGQARSAAGLSSSVKTYRSCCLNSSVTRKSPMRNLLAASQHAVFFLPETF